MNAAKAALFDAEAGAPWAAAPYGDADRPKIARLLAAAELDAGAQALEPGCGTGRLTTVLADAVGPQGRVVALDISRKMVEACRVTVRTHRHVAVHHAGVEDFALEPGIFNAIVCHQVVPHFDDLPAALARLARGLRPGGCLVVVHFIGAERVNAIHRAAANPILHYDRLPAPGEMSELLRAVGLMVDWAVDDELGYLVRARARSEPNGSTGATRGQGKVVVGSSDNSAASIISESAPVPRRFCHRFPGSPLLRFSVSPFPRFSGSPLLRARRIGNLAYRGGCVTGSPVLRFSVSPILRFSVYSRCRTA